MVAQALVSTLCANRYVSVLTDPNTGNGFYYLLLILYYLFVSNLFK